jgi:hypothetical protein
MNEEIRRILKLLEDGKINSSQAENLIEAIKDTGSHEEIEKTAGRFLRINVNRDGKNKLKFTVPIRFARAILRATGKLPVKVEGIKEVDLNMLKEAIEKEAPGKVLSINSDEGNTVEMIIE